MVEPISLSTTDSRLGGRDPLPLPFFIFGCGWKGLVLNLTWALCSQFHGFLLFWHQLNGTLSTTPVTLIWGCTMCTSPPWPPRDLLLFYCHGSDGSCLGWSIAGESEEIFKNTWWNRCIAVIYLPGKFSYRSTSKGTKVMFSPTCLYKILSWGIPWDNSAIEASNSVVELILIGASEIDNWHRQLKDFL